MTDSTNSLANMYNISNMTSPNSPKNDLSKRQFGKITGSTVSKVSKGSKVSTGSIGLKVSNKKSRFIVSEEIVEGKYNNTFDFSVSDSNSSNKHVRNGDGYITPPPRKIKLDPCLLIQEKHYHNNRE